MEVCSTPEQSLLIPTTSNQACINPVSFNMCFFFFFFFGGGSCSDTLGYTSFPGFRQFSFLTKPFWFSESDFFLPLTKHISYSISLFLCTNTCMQKHTYMRNSTIFTYTHTHTHTHTQKLQIFTKQWKKIFYRVKEREDAQRPTKQSMMGFRNTIHTHTHTHTHTTHTHTSHTHTKLTKQIHSEKTVCCTLPSQHW